VTVTLKDIAREVGFSVTTVSRALNDYDDVSAETKQKIHAVADALGYYPDVTARKLRKRRTDTIGFVIPTFGPRFSDPFFSELLAGIGNEASRHDFDLLVSTVAPGPEEEQAYRRKVNGRAADGLLIVRTRRADPRIIYLASQNFPFVAYGRSDLDLDFPYVDVDSARGVCEATQHLIGLGHRHIALILPPPNLMFAVHRLEGYKQALELNGIPYQDELVVAGELTERSGYQAANELLARNLELTAIVACNDLMALGAISALRERGIVPGRDVAITGFDDIPLAAHSHPPLTTVHQPVYDIGKMICRMLIQIVQGQELVERHVILEPRLVVRESTALAL
jgi:DNA-binding LacI/PurR family transcriptional regulator